MDEDVSSGSGATPADAPAIDPSRDRALAHLMAALAAAPPPLPRAEDLESDAQLVRRIGRFVPLEQLGRGGMGVVYAAFDPELDRKVALKVLQDRYQDQQVRLLREAQAMARLNHPHVAAVYEAGTDHGRVFLAMEFVPGQSLRQWAAERPRAWPDVLAMYLQAARGLAAAHAAGILHRDFKPDNAMVGRDGRVRVLDFGLARRDLAKADPSETFDESRPAPARDAFASALTEEGARVGTPAYMAPEQMRGEGEDARSDQFAFCVALAEALWGTRPAARQSADAALLPTPPPGARAPSLPRPLLRALERGLAEVPTRRFASMDALIVALERVQHGGGARRRWALLGAVALVGAVAFGFQRWEEARRARRCAAEGQEIATVWNDDARLAVGTAIAASGVSYAQSTAERVVPTLDVYVDDWQHARTEICAAEVADEDRERAETCLDDARTELATFVEQLAHPDPRTIERAITASVRLPRLERCRDVDLLRRTPSVPGEQREEIAGARRELARSVALAWAGKHSEALAVAQAVRAQADAIGWDPLRAAARLREGDQLINVGGFPDAGQAYVEAYFIAAQAGVPEIAQFAALGAAIELGPDAAAPEVGVHWIRLAEVEEARLPPGDGMRRAERLNVRAKIDSFAGRRREAVEGTREALAIRERVLGPDHPEVANGLERLGDALCFIDECAAGRELAERAVAIRERAFGPDHPSMAVSLELLARVRLGEGDLAGAVDTAGRAVAVIERAGRGDGEVAVVCLMTMARAQFLQAHFTEAREILNRVLPMMERLFGPDHPDVAAVVSNLAAIEVGFHEYERARPLLERGLATRLKTMPPDHPDNAISHHALGMVALGLHEYDRARTEFGAALAIDEKVYGEDNVSVAADVLWLANVALVQEQADEARPLCERGLAIYEKVNGPEHPKVAWPLTCMGEVELSQGRAAEALAPLERAWALRSVHDVPIAERAETAYALARALWDGGGDRTRARELAQQAVDHFLASEEKRDEDVVEVRAWIAAHTLANPPLGTK